MRYFYNSISKWNEHNNKGTKQDINRKFGWIAYVILSIFIILDPPENTKLTTTTNISATLKNSNVTFTCSAEGSPPPHEYRFYRNGTFLGNSSSGTFQTHVTKSGLYSCVSVNTAGNGEKGSVSITLVGEWNVTVSWIRRFMARGTTNNKAEVLKPGRSGSDLDGT